jgi:F-type H+-transporting ATPase subunit a
MLFAAKTISVGVHPELHILGLTIDYDIVLSTLLAAAIFCFLGFRMRAKATDGVPGKLQLIWEILVEQVSELADSAIGPEGYRFVPLGVTLFLFILICNWLDFLPTSLRPGISGAIFPAPTSDVNLPLAMVAFVIIWVHVESFKARGFKGYFKHYTKPFFALTPINVIEEITKPITMTFRLFGNIFSGVLMISVIVTLIPPYLSWIGLAVWKPFDELFIGAIQAFIFALLTIMYLGMGMSRDQH